MHTQPLSNADGVFTDTGSYYGACRKCGKKEVNYRVWKSNCGGYEDYEYTCRACGHSWWVDGIDS
jgi:DNA-directed RNA polymerase subunit M/transcription elongation factor TFIIS